MTDENGRPRAYALQAGEGWTYDFGIDFTVKAGELGGGRRLAFVEYTNQAGEEPEDHVHPTEDEIFYVLRGDVTFRCGGEEFGVSDGGFVFLPRGVEHGYQIHGEDARLLAVTSPAQEDARGGWGGFIGDVEASGQLRSAPPDR